MIDLKDLDIDSASNDGAAIELVHPVTLEPVGITIKVAGKDSDIFKDEVRKKNRERINAAKKSRSLNIDPDEIEAGALDLMIKCTLSWKNMLVDGKELEFNKKNVRHVYERFTWIREQVDLAINDRANFTKG